MTTSVVVQSDQTVTANFGTELVRAVLTVRRVLSFIVRLIEDRPAGEVAGEVVAVESGEATTFRSAGELVTFLAGTTPEADDAPLDD